MYVKRRIFRKGGAFFLAAALAITALPVSAQAATVKSSYKVGVGRTVNVTFPKRLLSVKVKNKKIASAVKTGTKKLKITGVKAGSTTVTVKYGKASKKLTVKVGTTALTPKTFATSLVPAQRSTVSVKAAYGAGDTLKWVSDDDAIVSVEKGTSKVSDAKVAANVLTAHNPGTANITVSSKNTGVSKKVKVTVKAATTPVPVSTIPVMTKQPATTVPVVTTGPATKVPDVTDPIVSEGPSATADGNKDVVTSTPFTTPFTTPAVTIPATPQIVTTPEAITCGALQVSANLYGATFTLTDSEGQVVQELKATDSEAAVRFTGLGFGTYTLTATKEGYVSSNVTVSVDSALTEISMDLKAVEDVRITQVHSTSLTRVQVDCSGTLSSVDRKDFSISGLIIYSAVLSGDRTSVILSTSQMTEGQSYTLTATGLTINGTPLATTEVGYQAKQVSYGLRLSVDGDDSEIRGDGKDSVGFSTSVCDEDGYVIKDLSGVEIAFSSQAGTLEKASILTNSESVSNRLYSQEVDKRTDTYVTATITSAANEQLKGLTVTRNIVLNPIDISEYTGIHLNNVTAEYTDRILLYFDQDISVTDYTQNRDSLQDVYGYDEDKLEILVYNAGKNSTATEISSGSMGNRNVVGLAPVEGNNRALWAYLDLDRDSAPLTKDGRVVVKVTDKTRRYETCSTKYATVNDPINPKIVRVDNVSLRTIRVYFNKGVQNSENAFGTLTADSIYRWTIDNVSLSDNGYGYGSAYAASITVGDFDRATGEDHRNEVTLTLGKNVSGNQIYLTKGTHHIGCKDIGDWTNVTSQKTNVCRSQSAAVTVKDNEELLSAKVTVDSPEQYHVTFSHAVSTAKIEKKLKLQEYSNSQWKDTGINTITITPILAKETDTEATEYIVEVNKDWTQAYSTSTSHKNYYNTDYRLHLAAGELLNIENGSLNPKISLPLTGEKMTTLDIESPKIVDVEQYGNLIYITMSEPVQIPGITEETPSENQKNSGVPNPVITFISADHTKTVPATVVSMADATDRTFCVSPCADLVAGVWQISIASISDDVGNTSETLTLADWKLYNTIAADSNFQVLWALAVPIGSTNPLTGNTNTGKERIYVKFSQRFKTYGYGTNAAQATNYTLNSSALPDKAVVYSSLAGYNDKANAKNNYVDLIELQLPAGTLQESENNLTVSTTIESIYGERLANGGTLSLEKRTDSSGKPYFAYRYRTTATSAITTVLELSRALSDTGYVNVECNYFSDGEQKGIAGSSTLSVTHAGTFDLTTDHASRSDRNTFKALEIRTQESGILKVANGIFGSITINAPNAEVVLDNVKTGSILVEDVLDGTLILDGGSICTEMEITDCSNGCKIKAESGASLAKVTVNTIGNVALDLGSGTDVTIAKPGKVTFLSKVASITLDATAQGVEIVNGMEGTAICTGSITDHTADAKLTNAIASVNAGIQAWEDGVNTASTKSFSLSSPSVSYHFEVQQGVTTFAYESGTVTYSGTNTELFTLTVTVSSTQGNSTYSVSRSYKMEGGSGDLAFQAG